LSTEETTSVTEEVIASQPKRINNITLRLTDEELDTIEQQSRKLELNRSDYLRHQALKPVRRLKPAKDLDILQYQELALLRRELSAQGNNLNQIARALNTLLQTGEPVKIDISRLEMIANESYAATKSILKLQKKHSQS
jgi:Bacterial mobilisation protein (MobC)